MLGALATAVAVASAVLATRAPSGVERRLRTLRDVRHGHALLDVVGRVVASRDREAAESLVVVKLAAGCVGAVVGVAVAAVSGWGPLAPAVLAYAGFIAPSLVADRTAARGQRDAERHAVATIEWLHALVASGRPLETALLTMASHPSGSRALDTCLEHVRRDYTLGVPMHVALARNGAEAHIAALVDLAARVERARDLGRGALGLLADLRDELRAAERERSLEAASHVEGKLTLVLTLCYLPALALLVIIPLFVTLLSGLFGT